MKTYPPCECGACEENLWNHADSCMWKGCSKLTFGNREKLELDERRNAEATGEKYMPLEVEG